MIKKTSLLLFFKMLLIQFEDGSNYIFLKFYLKKTHVFYTQVFCHYFWRKQKPMRQHSKISLAPSSLSIEEGDMQMYLLGKNTACCSAFSEAGTARQSHSKKAKGQKHTV